MNYYGQNPRKKRKKVNKLTLVLSCIAGALAVLVIVLVIMASALQKEPVPTEAPTTVPTTVPTEETTQPTETTVETTVPETEPSILPELEELYAENPDLAGWITIEDTVLDYPVMYTPEEPDKYLYKNFKGNTDSNGLPYLEEACSLDPESDNLIIYGHHMASGKMFTSLMNYANENYWKKHPIIRFSTLYEAREYEIVAAFYDRVYFNYEDVFKFYQFIDAEDEEAYNEAIAYYKEHAQYETGVTAEYGDRLITLVTCSYHHKYGRFVVVGREITDKYRDPVEETLS